MWWLNGHASVTSTVKNMKWPVCSLNLNGTKDPSTPQVTESGKGKAKNGWALARNRGKIAASGDSAFFWRVPHPHRLSACYRAALFGLLSKSCPRERQTVNVSQACNYQLSTYPQLSALNFPDQLSTPWRCLVLGAWCLVFPSQLPNSQLSTDFHLISVTLSLHI
jgi:hypothetical protein